MSAKKPTISSLGSSTIAKTDDGTIQINFTLPRELVEEKRKQTLKEIGETLEVPGFRKGKAPLDKVETAVNENSLLEKTLSKILPPLLGETIEKHGLKLAIYPKFTLLKANKEEDWQVRAETCEIPEVKLGEYKQSLQLRLKQSLTTLARAKKDQIWTPENSKKDTKPLSNEEKEQIVIQSLLETTKLDIPKILIEEEVNGRLSRLLQKIEKLGLSLEAYLSSLGKKAEDLRKDYEKQAREAIALELTLNKVAEQENVKVEEKEVDAIIKASSADKELAEEIGVPEKRKVVESILKRRKALDILISLA